MKKLLLLFLSVIVSASFSHAQTTLSITASKDNTLYEDVNGSLSNGVGAHIFTGRTLIGKNGDVRRALIQFNLSNIPANAIIDTVVLQMTINKISSSAGTDSIRVHTLNADWGEGSSNAPANEGGGTSAATGDATWIHNFLPSSTWTNAGGDFNPNASAAISSSGGGMISFGSSQLTADVNNWLTNPSQNFGWIVIADESSTSARRISSKDGSGTGPTLRVTYLTTGLSESANTKKLEIYPIPAEDYLMIEHRINVFGNQVRVFDTSGKLVLDKALNTDNRLNVADLKSGIYFLELRTKESNEAVTKKFVKN